MRSRLYIISAFLLLILTFVIDAYTPQTLVIAIVLDVPIVLAALTQSRRLTATFVGFSMVADVLAAIINAHHEGHWNAIGVADRGLTLLSIALVGILCNTLQENAKRVERLAVRNARSQREAALAAAGERIRETLSTELVVRAVVREAIPLLNASAVRWYPNGKGSVIIAQAGQPAEPFDEPIAPEIASITRRAIEEAEILVFTGTDVVSRFLIDRLQTSIAVAVPVRDRSDTLGVLLVLCDDALDDEFAATAQAYAELVKTGLVQARLFDELAQRNERLAEREEVIRDLVYALSHDLRTPLAALSLTLRQARDGGYGEFPLEYRDILAASLVSIDDLRRLAETLLLMARIEAGEHNTQPQTLDIYILAQDVVAEFEAMAQSRSITLLVTGDSRNTRADRADVRRAVVNLVANALQHTQNGGEVVVHCSASSRKVRLQVLDNGFGVPTEQLPFLFRRFSGGHAGSGSGLGLYLVRRIAEQNGGTVRYEARQPRGSVFSLELPEYDILS
jgi:signal transduction histidine kinase